MVLVERRKHLRYSCDLAVEVRTEEQSAMYPGKLADICLGGCFVSTVSPLPAGTPVTVIFHAPDLPAANPNGNGATAQGSLPPDTTAIAGRTVTSLPGNGMGIEFTAAADSESSARLKALIRLLENNAQSDVHTSM